MPRLIAQPQRIKRASLWPDDRKTIVQASVASGMFSVIDSVDIDPGALTEAKNCVIRYDRTSRRSGNVADSVAAPNTNKILGLAVWARSSGTVYRIRFTQSSIHTASSGAWTNITSGVPITPATDDRFNYAIIDDRFFFVANGSCPVQELNTSTNTYAALGNAPASKFIVGFGGRVFLAHVGGDPNKVAWSGNGNYSQFDPTIDISAGSLRLVDISRRFADPITGISATDTRLILLRERSIWVATVQPSATNPYYFTQALPEIGCDCPFTVVEVTAQEAGGGGGVAFVSVRYKSVFLYSPTSNTIERIGLPVENRLIPSIVDINNVVASYDTANAEYNILIPGTTSTQIWKYNFNRKAWCYDEIVGANAITFFDFSAASTSMDGLTGTMDSLLGSMDSLSTIYAAAPTRQLGMTDGTIIQEDYTKVDDAGTSFDTNVVSKAFSIPVDNIQIAELRFQVKPITYGANLNGTISIYYSTNDGASFNLGKVVQITSSNIYNPILIKLKKPINSRRIMWKLSTSNTTFDLNGYEIHYFVSGESRH